MKRVYVNEEWCLGCHLCEYNCAFANSDEDNMIAACKDRQINPRITIEEAGGIHFAVNCRECKDPLCIKSCIAGALYMDEDGMIRINKDRCVLCCSCIMACPYGALRPSLDGVMQKCELCTDNGRKTPACVEGCPNKAIVFEERV